MFITILRFNINIILKVGILDVYNSYQFIIIILYLRIQKTFKYNSTI